MSDITRPTKMQNIIDLAKRQYSIAAKHLDPYGHYKAKLSMEYINSLKDKQDGKLILVTAISPTPAGEGKTTTTVGLGDAMNFLDKKTIICLREPSLGPCFGIKGGATGGGRSQVVPMEDINLHFTGDFHAIGAAHNLLSALIDNHINHGNRLEIDPRLLQWKRVVDMNDRALRKITIGMGGVANGFLREEGYDIVVASEIMAILCLATDRSDLKVRLSRIIIGYKKDQITPVYASELNAHGSMAVLLKDAIKPNLVQTLENNLAIIHGGPFANIAHGCNSVTATKTALKLADYAITEAGFGADLGAEKFIDIKCRTAGLKPSVVVLVATIRALKFHGGVAKENLNLENLPALTKGFVNLEKHYNNIIQHYGLPCVICINHFTFDSEQEISLLQQKCAALGAQYALAKHWAKGSAGAEELAKKVINIADNSKAGCKFVYQDQQSIWDKINAVASKIYGACGITASPQVRQQISDLEVEYGTFPVCIAKTQMSFSTNPALKGAPNGHIVAISAVKVANGAGFIVAIAGNIMTMPGLPKIPIAERIDIDNEGIITGLF